LQGFPSRLQWPTDLDKEMAAVERPGHHAFGVGKTIISPKRVPSKTGVVVKGINQSILGLLYHDSIDALKYHYPSPQETSSRSHAISATVLN
jgi:hypothetical protein